MAFVSEDQIPFIFFHLFKLTCNGAHYNAVCVLQDQARAQAELLRRQEELERKAAELDRREREMQSLNASGGVDYISHLLNEALLLLCCIICEVFSYFKISTQIQDSTSSFLFLPPSSSSSFFLLPSSFLYLPSFFLSSSLFFMQNKLMWTKSQYLVSKFF